MNTTVTIIADQLTEDLAAIRKHMTVKIDDGVYAIANPPVLEFRNTQKGRDDLQKSELPSNWKQAVFLIWGDKPTQEDEPEPEDIPMNVEEPDEDE